MRNTFLTDFKFRVASFAKYAYSCGIKIPAVTCDSYHDAYVKNESTLILYRCLFPRASNYLRLNMEITQFMWNSQTVGLSERDE